MRLVLLFISLIFSQIEFENYILDENNFIIYEQEPDTINYELNINNDSNLISDYYHHQLIKRLYKNKNEFFLYLKSNEKYKVSEIINIDGNDLEVNILTGNLSKEISFKNNISNSGNFYHQKLSPKYLKY